MIEDEAPPDNELTRFMFLEFIVRIACLKFKYSASRKDLDH